MTEKRMQEMLAALSSCGIHVAGDFVMEKNIVHNVEAGGIGFQIVRGKESEEEAEERAETPAPQLSPAEGKQARDEELCHFIHPSLGDEEARRVHEELGNLVRRQSVRDICLYLTQLKRNGKLLLPQSVKMAYAELVRIGMPSGDGFSEKTFQKYYKN